MEIIFIVGAVQAFFLTILVFNKKNKFIGDYVLAAILILMGLLLISYTLEVKGIDNDYPIFLGFNTALSVLAGPLIYLYTIIYTGKSQKIQPLFSLHLLPYVVFTVIVFLKLTIYTEGSVAQDKFIIEDAKQPIFAVLGLFRIFAAPVYLILCLYILKNHTKRIGKYFSYTEHVDLKWLKYVLLIMFLLYAIVILINILSNFNDFIDYRVGDNVIYTALTVIVFLNGYYGIKQQIIFTSSNLQSKSVDNTKPLPKKLNNKKQYLNSGLSKEESQKHLERLIQYMEDDQPYLNGKLSLKEVADYLNISTNHLSQVINENLDKNFYDFVNGYRVELMKKKVLDISSSNLTILGMAYECGFNSKSSFNNIFKKVTGMTPSQYTKSVTT